MCVVEICMFAYNEKESITKAMEDIVKQDVFSCDKFKVILNVVANGCTDGTENVVENFIRLNQLDDKVKLFSILDKGKSRAWNLFVHLHMNQEAVYTVFCDADIKIDSVSAIREMLELLENNKNLVAVNSKPVKDISLKNKKNLVEKIIISSAGNFSDWKKSICGQFYCVRKNSIENTYLPIGLPVEDGYIAASLVTGNFSTLPDFEKITGNERIFHFYKSEIDMVNIINHQVRIVIGSSVNSALFDYIGSLNEKDKKKLKNIFLSDDLWLQRFLMDYYPKWYGWVPLHFLTKRSKRLLANKLGLNLIFKLIVGFLFDLIVYLKAQYLMSKGKGSGFW